MSKKHHLWSSCKLRQTFKGNALVAKFWVKKADKMLTKTTDKVNTLLTWKLYNSHWVSVWPHHGVCRLRWPLQGFMQYSFNPFHFPAFEVKFAKRNQIWNSVFHFFRKYRHKKIQVVSLFIFNIRLFLPTTFTLEGFLWQTCNR